jgi:hypothetical protein
MTTTVDGVKTPSDPDSIAASIGRGYQQIVGSVPSFNMLRTLTAQALLETNSGAAMYNYNFGGVKGAGPTGETASLSTHEIINGKDTVLKQNFRSYPSLDAGALDFVKLIVKGYSKTLPFAEQNDLTGYANALYAGHYFTADPTKYANRLSQLNATAGDAAKTWTPSEEPSTPSVTPSSGGVTNVVVEGGGSLKPVLTDPSPDPPPDDDDDDNGNGGGAGGGTIRPDESGVTEFHNALGGLFDPSFSRKSQIGGGLFKVGALVVGLYALNKIFRG